MQNLLLKRLCHYPVSEPPRNVFLLNVAFVFICCFTKSDTCNFVFMRFMEE